MATANDKECKRQKQLANKEKRMFEKINKEKNKQWQLLNKQGKSKGQWNLVHEKQLKLKVMHSTQQFKLNFPS